MKKSIFLVFIPVFFSLMPFAQALDAGDIEFIPIHPSVNSSFLLKVNAEGEPWLTSSSRVTWTSLGGGAIPVSFGSFHREGNLFICYFSGILDADPLNTCGPTPFREATDHEISINATNQFGVTDGIQRTQDISNLVLSHEITISNGTVSMLAIPIGTIATSVSYTVRYTNNLTRIPTLINQPLEYDPVLFRFTGNTTLDPGDYFIEFVGIDSFGNGGSVVRVSIPEEGGAACNDGIQNGNETDIDCGGPDCVACGNGGDSDSAEKIHSARAVSDVVIRKGLSVNISDPNFIITDTANETLSGLRAVVPSNLSSFLNVSLSNDTLQPNGSMFFTVRLINVQEGMELVANVDVLSGQVKVGEIPIEIRVSVLHGEGDVVVVQGGDLSIEPLSWDGDYVVSEPATKSFILRNIGNQTITGITFVSEIIGLGKNLPSSIGAGSSATMELSFNTSTPGNYCCFFTVNSSGGSQNGMININFFPNVSSSITVLSAELNQIKTELGSLLTADQMSAVNNGIISPIETLLGSANTDFSLGNYDGSERKLLEVQSKLNILRGVKDLLNGITVTIDNGGGGNGGGSSSGGLDFTTILMVIVVVVVILGVAFYFFRIRKPSEDGEEYEEEFEYEEEGPEGDEEEL